MPSDPRPVFRFAPSPNGELHLGHALSALVGWEAARAAGGRFLLRIEDIDTGRARPEFVAAISRDLRWLGLDWEEPALVQSTRFAAYAAAARRLEATGLLYPCFATRAEIEAAATSGGKDPDGAPLYPGLWKGRSAAEIAQRKAAGEPFALRIDIDRAIATAKVRLAGRPLTFTELGEDGRPQIIPAEPALWGDAVILRKDVPASYHLAVVVDDAWQGVSHVTRGRDLYAATHLHRLLQVLLDLPEPLYRHHRLITDVDGRKLAKSARDAGLRSLREAGATPADVRRLVGLSQP
jgi:glutamyl-Q tRNA(Asp) synthetase